MDVTVSPEFLIRHACVRINVFKPRFEAAYVGTHKGCSNSLKLLILQLKRSNFNGVNGSSWFKTLVERGRPTLAFRYRR